MSSLYFLMSFELNSNCFNYFFEQKPSSPPGSFLIDSPVNSHGPTLRFRIWGQHGFSGFDATTTCNRTTAAVSVIIHETTTCRLNSNLLLFFLPILLDRRLTDGRMLTSDRLTDVHRFDTRPTLGIIFRCAVARNHLLLQSHNHERDGVDDVYHIVERVSLPYLFTDAASRRGGEDITILFERHITLKKNSNDDNASIFHVTRTQPTNNP